MVLFVAWFVVVVQVGVVGGFGARLGGLVRGGGFV